VRDAAVHGAAGISGEDGAPDPALKELREAYRGGGLVIVAGEQIPVSAGLPSRARLVELLADHACARGASLEELGEIGALLRGERIAEALAAARRALGAAEFGALVERALDDRDHEIPPLAQAIAAIAPCLRAILSVNLDHLLERALTGRWPAMARATADLAQRRGYLLKLHGTLWDRATWRLTQAEQEYARASEPWLQDVLGALSGTCTLLFVGGALAGDGLGRWLHLRRDGDHQRPRHFMLSPAGAAAPYWRASLEASGVRPILYRDDGHDAEATLLHRAFAGAQGPSSAAGAVTPAPAAGERDGRALGAGDEGARTAPDPRALQERIAEGFTPEELEMLIANAFPEIRGGLAGIVSPKWNHVYQVFQVVRYFERNGRLDQLQAALDEAQGRSP
jgi:hypothetical protein